MKTFNKIIYILMAIILVVSFILAAKDKDWSTAGWISTSSLWFGNYLIQKYKINP